MKKSLLLFVFFCLACGMSLSAQSFEGRYTNAQNLNANDIQINQIVLSFNGTAYEGNWETALATGEQEVSVKLQNVIVTPPDLTLTFDKNGQTYQGHFISDGDGGYNLVLNQTIFSQKDW